MISKQEKKRLAWNLRKNAKNPAVAHSCYDAELISFYIMFIIAFQHDGRTTVAAHDRAVF